MSAIARAVFRRLLIVGLGGICQRVRTGFQNIGCTFSQHPARIVRIEQRKKRVIAFKRWPEPVLPVVGSVIVLGFASV